MKRLLLCVIMLLIYSSVYAATVTVAWDPNEDADYYEVYRKKSGETDDKYVSLANNITVTEVLLTISEDNQPYDYTVKAFNTCGNSSDFSNAITHNAYVVTAPQKVIELRMGY